MIHTFFYNGTFAPMSFLVISKIFTDAFASARLKGLGAKVIELFLDSELKIQF